MENKTKHNYATIEHGKQLESTSSRQSAVVRGGDHGHLKATRLVNYQKNSRKKSSPFPISFILGIVTLTALVLFLMMNYAEVDKYNSSIAELKSQLTDLQKEADKLEQRLDRKDDLIYVEEYASENLGMVKSTDLQRVNVTLIGKDDSDIYKYDDGQEGGLGVLLSGFGKIIRDFFN